MAALLEGLLHSLVQLLLGAALVGMLSVCAGAGLAVALRLGNLRWTWSLVPIAPALAMGYVSLWLAVFGVGTCMAGCVAGRLWHVYDLGAGGDHAEAARERIGIFDAVLRLVSRWQAQRGPRPWVRNGRLEVGRDERGRSVCIPASGRSGSHTLIVGATGSGKTCGQAWIAGRLIEHGHGAIVIDPKGDELLRGELEAAARAVGKPFSQWSPNGPLAYNPYAHGDHTEIADKALAGELFTEPHYLRQAQRYLGQAVRAMRAANIDVTAAALMAHMNPEQLEQTAKRLPDEQRLALHDYLDSLGSRQRHELAGVRDRLSILAESDVAPWLDPAHPGGALDLREELPRGGVVYFALESDRRPLLAKMLAGAIVGDLITLAAVLQQKPIPTVVAIDEFSGGGAAQIARLFARGRSAGMSVVLSTQEFADLKAAGHDPLRDQVLGNLEALISYRQTVPESAELIAAVAGTQPAWVATQHTAFKLLTLLPTGRGWRRREHEHVVHPTRIKRLRTGEAVVIVPGGDQPPQVVHMHHPRQAVRLRSVPEGRLLWPAGGSDPWAYPPTAANTSFSSRPRSGTSKCSAR